MIRLATEEAWEFVAAAHTGILTTLRRDGMPITLPVWFVVQDRTIAMMTPAGTKKIARIRHDPRASFLVESGERWAELRGVHFTGRVQIVEGPDAMDRINDTLTAKYVAFRPQLDRLPSATQSYYAKQVFLRFIPDPRILTWDNSRIAKGQKR
ncbi:MAG TPA: pyridoxamine 5'-phosphate oxidase family protein [Mycobacterium sp.]|uniref:pyridoxamine 5'-phosphate oxidase family protein n=1 Tax=Mycobacterium sp. TaxID=1785 RepID=UPI002D75C148|nr:pyridoxamine 5'-phosphate oxidase family protein [Mycobacterium sp.]HZU45712.1 pyridoxamine 5'-phosphate oxidase family protein [Mycobacterium sp.]